MSEVQIFIALLLAGGLWLAGAGALVISADPKTGAPATLFALWIGLCCLVGGLTHIVVLVGHIFERGVL